MGYYNPSIVSKVNLSELFVRIRFEESLNPEPQTQAPGLRVYRPYILCAFEKNPQSPDFAALQMFEVKRALGF